MQRNLLMRSQVATLTRQFLADGEWITKLIEDRMEDIRPCICCHNACFNMTHYKALPTDNRSMMEATLLGVR